ncbi:MAG TPA: adenylate/guanylate cyclase domain-containing protein [Geminicoccaceae bacterium]|nr:adenylate/guanylate cyclase domain-containing protein [Geminicoccus sp.]HMU51616.1 adenylate/guanylate cyclase domain-containing protein [Geminicoccaceae bacterium]
MRAIASSIAAARPRALRALAVAIACALLFLSPTWRTIEDRGFDVATTLLPPDVPARPPIVVVAIDEPSFTELGRRWPWPRELHAGLIDALTDAGAAAIGFDVVFAEPSTASDDQALAAAIGRSGRVVLAADEAVVREAHSVRTMRIDPLPDLLAAGARTGFVGVALDRDGILRRLPARSDLFARRLLEVAGIGAPSAGSEPPLLRFLPSGRGFRILSYYQAREPRTFLPPDLLRGAIVLVGLVVKTTPEPNQLPADTFLTPLLGSQDHLIAGVEVQATAVANLAHGLLLREAGWPVRLTLLAIFIAATASAFGDWSPLRAALVLAAAALSAAATSALALLWQGAWLPPLLPLLGTCGVVLAEGAAAVVSERQGRRRIKDAFGRYLSPELVEILARDPGRLRLGGERRVMTFLFCDIRGFTNLSEQLQAEPERLTQIINRFLTCMTRAIRARRGTIDKFMGDCVMAFWNAPLDEPDHAGSALQCALEMEEALAGLNAELAREGVPPLRIGIGINTGPCVVGNMGSQDRFAYSVMGDAVNLASRLEGLGKLYGVTIVVGEATAGAVPPGRFGLLELDLVAVKGKALPVRIFTLLPEPAPAALAAAQSALLAAYRAGDVPAAETALAMAGTAGAPDRLRRLYATRLAELAGRPVPAGWDGVLRLDSK